jgi:hypothetical protein
LRSKREELASVGVDIDEKDYRSTVISSLPTFLSNFASSQLAVDEVQDTMSERKNSTPKDIKTTRG